MKFQTDLVESTNFENLLELIALLNRPMNKSAQHVSLRLITILATQWGYQKICEYANHLLNIIAELIDQKADGATITYLVTVNLDKFSVIKKLMS